MDLVYVTDKNKITELSEIVYDMCQRAYQPIGGFNSLASVNDVPKRVKLLKIVMSKDNDGKDAIGGCGLYRVVNGGYKGIGYAGNKDVVPDYRECVQLIVKDDIAKYNDWYWVEASGAIQHYFEKHNGHLIPNIYVSTLLSRDIPPENLLPDGFSYKTVIGNMENPTEVVKRLFGFPNQDAYDTLMKVYGTLDNFSSEIRKMLNENDNETAYPKMESIQSLSKRISVAVMYICNLDECVMENRLTAIPVDWMKLLDKSLEILKQEAVVNNNESISNAIELGTDLQESLSVLSVVHFQMNEKIKHITI